MCLYFAGEGEKGLLRDRNIDQKKRDRNNAAATQTQKAAWGLVGVGW